MSSDKDRIRLADSGLKQILEGGIALISPGIAALGATEVKRLFQTISIFDDYCAVKEAHAVGQLESFNFDGRDVLFRIDYSHEAQKLSSPNLHDTGVTRCITIMLSAEAPFIGQP